jgi:hypothetical protein
MVRRNPAGHVTDAVMAEVTEWQNRPLEPMYPVVFFDCQHVKIRDEGTVRNKAVYLALGVLPDGTRVAGRRGFLRRSGGMMSWARKCQNQALSPPIWRSS